MRPSASASPSIGRSFSVADSTSATQSANVVAPGAVQEKRTVDVERNASPSSRPVRSSAMS